MRKDRGFTLIELMVTVSVLAILLGIGVPSMVEFVKTNRRAAAVNALVTDLQRARSAAAGSGRRVVVCHSTDSASCSGAGNPDWSDGWIVFSDQDNNGALDGADTLLAVGLPQQGISMPSTQTAFTFTSGFRGLAGSVGGTVNVCAGSAATGKAVILNATGRPRLQDITDPSVCP